MCVCPTAGWRASPMRTKAIRRRRRACTTQAEAFRHLAPAGRTPRLHDVIEPRAGLPGGALIVDCIDGRAPRLPDELGAMADTLARIHALPLPAAGSPIPRQKNPFLETLAAIEQNATRFLDKAVPDSGARAEIAEELRPDARHGAGRRQARAAAHRGAGRHPSRQLHRRSRRHRLVRRSREGPCRLARDRSRACNACQPRRCGIPMSAKCCHATRCSASTRYISRRSGRQQAAALEPWLRADAPADLAAHHAFHGALAGADAQRRAIRRIPHNGATPASSRR